MTIAEIQKTRGIKLPITNLGYLKTNDVFYDIYTGDQYTITNFAYPMIEVYGNGKLWAWPFWTKVSVK